MKLSDWLNLIYGLCAYYLTLTDAHHRNTFHNLDLWVLWALLIFKGWINDDNLSYKLLPVAEYSWRFWSTIPACNQNKFERIAHRKFSNAHRGVTVNDTKPTISDKMLNEGHIQFACASLGARLVFNQQSTTMYLLWFGPVSWPKAERALAVGSFETRFPAHIEALLRFMIQEINDHARGSKSRTAERKTKERKCSFQNENSRL